MAKPQHGWQAKVTRTKEKWLQERWQAYLQSATWRCPQGGAHYWTYDPPTRRCLSCGKEEPIPEGEVVTLALADESNDPPLWEEKDIVAVYRAFLERED